MESCLELYIKKNCGQIFNDNDCTDCKIIVYELCKEFFLWTPKQGII